MNTTNISTGQVVEAITTSSLSINYIVMNYFINDKTIVHCINNNKDYKKSEAPSLIAYFEEKINNN